MVGEQLRKEREKQNFTVDDVVKETSISKKYLEALEREDYEALPGDVYTKGFIRNYSRFLKIDGDKMLALFNEERGNVPKIEPVDKVESPKQEPIVVTRKPREVKKQPIVASKSGDSKLFSSGDDFHNRVESGSSTLKKVCIGLCAFVVLFLGSVYVIFSDEETAPGAKPKVQTEIKVAEKSKEETPKPAPVVIDEVKVDFLFNDNCWCQIVVDGKQVYEGTAKAKETMSYTGKESVYIYAGNAGGVEVTYNGNSIGALGEVGQIAERTFNKANGKENVKENADVNKMVIVESKQPSKPATSKQAENNTNEKNIYENSTQESWNTYQEVAPTEVIAEPQVVEEPSRVPSTEVVEKQAIPEQPIEVPNKSGDVSKR